MRYTEEKIMQVLMRCSLFIILGGLLLILLTLLVKGGAVLIKNPGVLITVPSARYLLGGEGGFFHAVLGSFYMVFPATLIALVLGSLIAGYLHSGSHNKTTAWFIRIVLDILWGIPSLLYGVFVLILLIMFQSQGCLLAGIFSLSLLEFPIIARYIDESLRTVPVSLKENAISMGLTRRETLGICFRYSLPGILAGTLLGLGRGMGDAASVIFSAGGSGQMPEGLLSPATTLPVIIFQQAGSFASNVREQAYVAGLSLMILILIVNILSNFLQNRFSKNNQRRS